MSEGKGKSYIDSASYLDKKYHQALLFDFYGELLKENNREIYEDYILNDLSLSEIADERGISRQGIHDTIKRTNQKLEEYENKIHLLRRYASIQSKVNDIQMIIDEIKNTDYEYNDENLENNVNFTLTDRQNRDNILCRKLADIELILKDIIKET